MLTTISPFSSLPAGRGGRSGACLTLSLEQRNSTSATYTTSEALCIWQTWFNELINTNIHYSRAWNNSQPLAIFQPIFTIWPSKSNLLGQIYCTIPMGKPLIVYRNVPAIKEWPTNFKLLFWALYRWLYNVDIQCFSIATSS